MDLLNNSNLNDLFANTILQLYADASFSGLSGNDVFFSFSWPMSPLQDRVYQNPWAPDNPDGSMLAVENISELVNTIPTLARYYTPSGISVSDIYELILSGYTLPQQPPGAQAMKSAGLMDILKLDLSALGIQMQQASSPVGDIMVVEPTPDKEDAMEAERQQANEKARQRALQLTQSGTVMDETAIPVDKSKALRAVNREGTVDTIVRSAVTSSLSTVFTKANAIFTNTRLASIKYPQLSFHASEILPANFADITAAANWPSVSLRYRVTAGGVSENVTVSYKCCRVDIIRSWMVSYLLSMQGWGIQSQQKGWLSAGTMTNNKGVFPLLPVSLIVCRNLVIRSDSGDLNYNVEGLQVMAYVSKLIPFLPTLA